MWASVEYTHKLIFEKGRLVNGTAIEQVLGDQSLTPTWVSFLQYKHWKLPNVHLIQNAFSHVLLPFGVNYFNMFIIDFLHEVELGVWRALFWHNLQILYAVSGNAVVELDKW
jgi:hypothetical protein